MHQLIKFTGPIYFTVCKIGSEHNLSITLKFHQEASIYFSDHNKPPKIHDQVWLSWVGLCEKYVMPGVWTWKNNKLTDRKAHNMAHQRQVCNYFSLQFEKLSIYHSENSVHLLCFWSSRLLYTSWTAVSLKELLPFYLESFWFEFIIISDMTWFYF